MSGEDPTPFRWTEHRLRRRQDFQRTYQVGRRWTGRFVRVFVIDNGGLGLRFGLTVTRKSGGAVVRNRLRRQLREIVRKRWKALPVVQRDVVIHVLPGVSQVAGRELHPDLAELLERALLGPARRGPRAC